MTAATTTLRPRRRASRTLLGLAALSAVVGASGCGAVSAVNSSLTGVDSRHYDTRADAPERGDLAFVLPDAVPQDATDVSVTVKTEEAGVTTWAWTSPEEPPGSCAPADGTPSPPLDSPKGFPDDLDASGAVVCDGIVEVRDGERTYAWPDAGSGSSGTSG